MYGGLLGPAKCPIPGWPRVDDRGVNEVPSPTRREFPIVAPRFLAPRAESCRSWR